MKYRHLLVPVTMNDPDQRALDEAFELALQSGASTTLIYVIEAIEEPADADDEDADLRAFYEELEDNIRGRLKELSKRFEQAGLVIRPEVIVGQTAREIVRYSAMESVDLIVMRSERIDLNRPAQVLGSLSHQVSMFCQCPVILLK